ncbi:MAG: hypothetical protein IJ225_06575 [Solobacterium sp.]|nr:hypothetical protein [Solobacterium sp.]
MEWMTKDNATDICRKEMYLYTTYKGLLRDINDEITGIYASFEPSSPKLGSDGISHGQMTLEQRYIQLLMAEKDTLVIKGQCLMQLIAWIERMLYRMPSTIRIYAIKYYMLKEDMEVIAKEAELQPRVVQRKILTSIADVMSQDDVIEAYNTIVEKANLNDILSEQEINKLKHRRATALYRKKIENQKQARRSQKGQI